MDTNLLNGELSNILNLIAAAGGLGTAAMGLVDASKALGGGPSNFGFGMVEKAVDRFLPATSDGPQAFGKADILRTLKANWINGVAEADQKAKARALIHLRLTKGDAPSLARLAGVDAATLQSVATKAATGDNVTPQEIAVLGQFDVVLSAALDEAYERGDQAYRNATKLLAVAVATILAVWGGWLIYGQWSWGYFGSWTFALSFLVGLSAAPIAPVAKDLASSLQAAVTAVGAAKKLAP